MLWAGLGLALAISIVFLVAGWRAEWQLVHTWGVPLDDSWIHCQIARNLTDGHGWSYNPGVPVQNSSGPLWTVLVAVGFLVFGPQVWVPKILGAVCLLGCVAYAWKVARTLSGDAWAAGTAGVLAALSAPLAWHGLSGMETPLATVLVAATIDLFYAWDVGRRRYAWTLPAALAVMTRPETLLLVPLLALERFRLGRQTTAAPWREMAASVGLAIAFLLPYFALNLAVAGSLFPATFAAKAGDTGLGAALRNGDMKELLVALSLYPYTWGVHAIAFFAKENFAVLLLAAVGAWAAARGPRRALAPAVLLVLLPALRGAAAPHVTPGVQHGRYIACLLSVYFACAGVGVRPLVRAALPGAGRWMRAGLATVAVLAALSLLRLEWRTPAIGPGPLAALGIVWPGVEVDPVVHYTLRDEKAGLLVVALGAALLLVLGLLPRRALGATGIVVVALAVGVQGARAAGLPQLYARNVRNIQEMDVELGRWVKTRVPPGKSIAVNDIGAIAFFGERPLVDAMGLATPELVPYASPSRLRTLIGLRRLRPEVCIFFPGWFPAWMERPSLFVPLLRQRVQDNTILGGSQAVVFGADWDRFARYYSDALLEKLDPPEAYASMRGHWRRGLLNLHVQSRSELYMRAGDAARGQRDLEGAERHYRTALAIDPQEAAAWTGLLEVLAARNDRAGYGTTAQEMVRALPASSPALERLADWQFTVGQVEVAGRTFEAALALHPDDLGLLGKLEQYWTRQGDPARAAGYRERRLELTPRAQSEGAPHQPAR